MIKIKKINGDNLAFTQQRKSQQAQKKDQNALRCPTQRWMDKASDKYRIQDESRYMNYQKYNVTFLDLKSMELEDIRRVGCRNAHAKGATKVFFQQRIKNFTGKWIRLWQHCYISNNNIINNFFSI